MIAKSVNKRVVKCENYTSDIQLLVNIIHGKGKFNYRNYAIRCH